MLNSEAPVCSQPSVLMRIGAVDRLRDRLNHAKEQVSRLEALLKRLDANPQVADLLNEISKEL